MTRKSRRFILTTILAITTVGDLAYAQRGGGARGGGARGGAPGGGGARGGAPGGGGARGGAPGGGGARGGAPGGGMVGGRPGNAGRPAANYNRPAFGGINAPNRPNNPGGSRPPTANRPSRPGGDNLGIVNRPNAGNRPNIGNLPNAGNRPNIGNLPNAGNRPNIGNLPNAGNRPNIGNLPNAGNRPNIGNLPNAGNRPNIGNLPNAGNRPNIGNRPDININNRPNIGNRPNVNINNRPNISNRPNVNINNRPININNNITNIHQNNINNSTRINRSNFGSGFRPGGWNPGWNGGGWNGGWNGGGWARPNPYVGYHRGWVNGYWNGNYNSRGWNNWGTTALGVGVGVGVAAWGMGSLLNNWGYSSFVNPYYAYAQQPTVVVAGAPPVAFDYSRPIDLMSELPPQEMIDQSVASFDSARSVFTTGDYAQSLALADQAIKVTPNDPILHEFRAICLFAMGRYDEAAAPLYTVLSVGPGWDWTTLVSLYPNVDVYTQQLRALEAFVAATPRAAAARFVLASLYMTQGDAAAATTMLKQVVAIQPQDRLSAQLLEALDAHQAQPTSTPAAASSPIDPAAATPPAIPAGAEPPADPAPSEFVLPSSPVPAKLVGTWTASPAKDVAIKLTLDDAKGFVWSVTDHGQTREFKGTAGFDDEQLAFITSDNQPPMVGMVAWKDDAQFEFHALGAPAEDPGLSFRK